MVPTLEVGDYLFASKFAYGYSRHSVPFGLLPIEGRTFDTAPALGDIAVLRRPSDPSTDYIKRIIGLPGDKIQMIDGVLHINDQAVKLEETGSYSSDEIRSAKVQHETLQNGVSYSVLDVIDGSTGDNTSLLSFQPPATSCLATIATVPQIAVLIWALFRMRIWSARAFACFGTPEVSTTRHGTPWTV